MSFLQRNGATARRRVPLIAAGLVLLFPAPAAAQATTRPRKPAPESAEVRARREAILEKIDSLRWHFEHERLSDEERDAVRREMTTAFRALEETMVHVRAMELQAAREAERSVRVMSRTPGAMTVTVGRRFRPSGYLGLSFDGPNSEDVRNNELFVRFYQYPLIALVEPGSPAERGGVRKGDTLLALNGTDVVGGEVALSRMLVPDERITIRVRRDGDTRNLPVVVGRAPDYVVRRLNPPTAVAAPVAPRSARSPDAPVAVAPAPAPAAFVWQFTDGIGGAKVETITEGLGKALGIGSGVLVVAATAGTPAWQSGLRDGDVIVKAAGKPVSTIRELRNALAWSESDDGVKLVVVRERKQREVHFRW
jgi:predicted metalloprotease with PDZ domain